MESQDYQDLLAYSEVRNYLGQTPKNPLTREQEVHEFTLLEEHYQDYQNSVLRIGQVASGIDSLINNLLETGSKKRDNIFSKKDNRYLTQTRLEITPDLLRESSNQIRYLLKELTDSESKEKAHEISDLLYTPLNDLNLKRQFVLHTIPSFYIQPFDSDSSAAFKTHQKEKIEQATCSLDNYIQQRNKIAERNLKLVVSVAKKYMSTKSDLLDLIQEGNQGLLRAIQEFDLTLGNRFSTYAEHWIRRAIVNECEKNRIIRLPPEFYGRLIKVEEQEKLLSHQLRRKPSNQEIEDHLNPQIRNAAFCHAFSQIKVNSLDLSPEAFNQPQEPITPDNYSIDTEEIKKALALLDERQRHVIVTRYGLNGSEQTSLKDIPMNLSRPTVSKIHKEALKKLRNALIT